MEISKEIEANIRRIGQQLDNGAEMRVKNGGFIAPGKSPVLPATGTKETHHERGKKPARSPTRPRQRAAAGQGTTGRPRTASPPAPLAHTDLRQCYEAEIGAVVQAYPGAQAWPSEDGLFLLVESRLLAGLERAAVIVLAIRYQPKPALAGWAFWDGLNWIGPRHTNYTDGSICAFDLRDDTWQIGKSLVELLDLYTVWAFRHLHLQVCGRWPGFQSVPLAWDRRRELRGDEFCGCGTKPYKRYADCCQAADWSGMGLRERVQNLLTNRGLKRSPPPEICKFSRERTVPPSLDSVLPIFR